MGYETRPAEDGNSRTEAPASGEKRKGKLHAARSAANPHGAMKPQPVAPTPDRGQRHG